MTGARRLGVLVATWLLVVTAAALWLPHEWDWHVFEWLDRGHVGSFSDRVAIIDIAWSPDKSTDRRRIAAVLDRLRTAGKPPTAAIIDVEFDPCQTDPCGEPMERARQRLTSSIRAAAGVFPVYALEEPQVDGNDGVVGPLNPHDDLIYGALSGAAHTHFTALRNSTDLFYRACYALVPYSGVAGIGQNVWSMVDRVLLGKTVAAGTRCDTSHLPVHLGSPLPARGHPIYAATDATIPKLPAFDDEYVIIGAMAVDRSPFTDRSGPELLGWALSNALDLQLPSSIRTLYDTRPQNGMLLLFVPGFSALAVVCFVAVFGVLRRARLRGARPALPWLSSVAAAVLTLAGFAVFEAWMLQSRQIQPQVTLISLSAVLAAGLCGTRAHQIIADERGAIDVTPAETNDYDVFISYAHEEGAWVLEHVYTKLRDARLPNGAKLSVFFDTSSIRGGTAWQEKISLAIDASRFVVPIYSATYFTKPYCRFEARRAHRKWIAAGEDSRCVLPVMRGHPSIDKTVDDIQAISIDDQPDVVDRYVDEIVERIASVRIA